MQKFKLNNKSIALNVLYVPCNTEKIRHACKSRNILKSENQVIVLMITYDVAVKQFSALFRGKTSNNNGNFYCINCLHSYRTASSFL